MVTMGSVQIALGNIEKNVNTWNPSLEYISLGSGGGMHEKEILARDII